MPGLLDLTNVWSLTVGFNAWLRVVRLAVYCVFGKRWKTGLLLPLYDVWCTLGWWSLLLVYQKRKYQVSVLIYIDYTNISFVLPYSYLSLHVFPILLIWPWTYSNHLYLLYLCVSLNTLFRFDKTYRKLSQLKFPLFYQTDGVFFYKRCQVLLDKIENIII